jgi:hypothetical protein
MGLFDKLFGGGKSKQQAVVVEAPPCPHSVLVPRWDSVEDMGKAEKATRYMCESCHEMFTPQEAEELQASIAQRMEASLQDILATSEATETTAETTPEDKKAP